MYNFYLPALANCYLENVMWGNFYWGCHKKGTWPLREAMEKVPGETGIAGRVLSSWVWVFLPVSCGSSVCWFSVQLWISISQTACESCLLFPSRMASTAPSLPAQDRTKLQLSAKAICWHWLARMASPSCFLLAPLWQHTEGCSHLPALPLTVVPATGLGVHSDPTL